MKTKETVLSILYFVGAFGFTSLVQTQVITMDRYITVTIFLIIITVFLTFYFKKTLHNYFSNVSKRSLALITLAFFIHVSTVHVISAFLPQPDWPFSSRGTSFLLQNDYYLFSKPFDILVQQLLILLLVLRLDALGLSLKKIIILFIFGFGAIHIFQIFKTDVVIGLSFTAGAIIFSFVYPYMILRRKNGFIYNYMMHLFLYNIAAILAYTLY